MQIISNKAILRWSRLKIIVQLVGCSTGGLNMMQV